MVVAEKLYKRWPLPEIEADLAALLRQREAINREIAICEHLLEFAKSVDPPAEPPDEAQASQPSAALNDGGVPGLREGIRRILGEDPHRPWKLAEVYRELVRRGWVSNDASGRNRLQLRMAAMANHGELVKPEYGYYQLGPHQPLADESEEVPTLLAVRGERFPPALLASNARVNHEEGVSPRGL